MYSLTGDTTQQLQISNREHTALLKSKLNFFIITTNMKPS